MLVSCYDMNCSIAAYTRVFINSKTADAARERDMLYGVL